MRCRQLLLLPTLVAFGCIKPLPTQRLATPVDVATLLVHDDIYQNRAFTATDELSSAISEALRQRNLVDKLRKLDIKQFSRLRDSARRLKRLGSESNAPLLMLVESQARYYGEIRGRFRWNVYLKVTLSERTQLDSAVTEQFEQAAIMPFAHQKEADAISSVAKVMARQVGTMIDQFLAGRAL
ncbi:MAG: hypothetical protein H6707_03750 [Deltaproteobacteria bacterium]|nr:hypothetical protein [Deltaproteobacteria bacterium]